MKTGPAADHDLWTTDITIQGFSSADPNVMRRFTVNTDLNPGNDGAVAYLQGWVGFNISDDDIADDADAISSEVGELGYAAAQIREAYSENWIDTVILIEMIVVENRAEASGSQVRLSRK